MSSTTMNPSNKRELSMRWQAMAMRTCSSYRFFMRCNFRPLGLQMHMPARRHHCFRRRRPSAVGGGAAGTSAAWMPTCSSCHAFKASERVAVCARKGNLDKSRDHAADADDPGNPTNVELGANTIADNAPRFSLAFSTVACSPKAMSTRASSSAS